MQHKTCTTLSAWTTSSHQSGFFIACSACESLTKSKVEGYSGEWIAAAATGVTVASVVTASCWVVPGHADMQQMVAVQ